MKKKIANGIELLFLIVSYIIMSIPCITLAVTSPKGLTYETTMSAMDTISK